MIKDSILTIVISLGIILLIRCEKSENNIDSRDYETPEISELPHLMKGYELYSWKENEDWYYTLIAGTNKTKTFEEISSTTNLVDESKIKITTNSVKEIQKVIAKLPKDELIFWLGEEWIKLAWGNNIHRIKLPDDEIQNALLRFCNEHQIRLSIIE